MTYQVADIEKDVRVALDQNMVSDALAGIGDVDTLALDEIIESKIEDAAKMIELSAPLYLLGTGEYFSDDITWEDRETAIGGSIELPNDFMRLITFKMSDWDYAVTSAISEDDPTYAQQKSRFGGIRGNTQKPVVAITNQETGLVLEFYSCNSDDATIDRARYLPLPKIANNQIDLCDRLKPAIVYYIAYLTALSIGNGDAAAGLLQTAMNMAEIEQQ